MPTDEKLENLIDDVQDAARMIGSSRRDEINDGYDDELVTARARLVALFERLKAGQLEPEEAKALLAVRCGFGNAAFVHPDTFASALKKLRSIVHSNALKRKGV